jgi:hypothetical protein
MMKAIDRRTLSAWILAAAMLTPTVIGRANHPAIAPTEGVMHVEVTYTEEANITDKTKDPNGAEEDDVTRFSFRATAVFDQRVMMQTIAGAGVSFYPVENANQHITGGVSYLGEIKRTALDEKHRPSLDEKSVISFAGVVSDDSASGVPDDNAAGIQFGIQSNLIGDCKGKRTLTTYIAKPGGEEKKVETSEINACGTSDELHVSAVIIHAPLSVDLRQLPNGKEVMRYAGQFHVTSCNLNPQYCAKLKSAEAAANTGPNSEAMSDNWIGATTTGTMATGFKINLTMFKELKVDGTWKRYLQMVATVTPVSQSRASVAAGLLRSLETADRLRAMV